MANASESFAFLLRAIATHENALLLNIVSQEIANLFADDFARNLRWSPINERFFSAETSLLLATRTLWSLIPSRLFTSIDPDFEALAEQALVRRFQESPGAEKIGNLALIFKRIRTFKREGRSGTSLNIDRPTHKAILDKQAKRCALCNYTFDDNDLYYETELDSGAIAHLRQSFEGEIALGAYYRRPQLDHIIPIFLGGDSKANWQILCGSCNQGKGDALSWIFRRGWMPSSSLSELDTLTPSLRYAALCRYRAQSTDNLGVNELRIFKVDEGSLVYFENLTVKAIEI